MRRRDIFARMAKRLVDIDEKALGGESRTGHEDIEGHGQRSARARRADAEPARGEGSGHAGEGAAPGPRRGVALVGRNAR
jgi:hypothetical protein